MDSFNLDERQTVVMKLASTGTYRGSYQIRLGGSVDFKSDDDASPPKKSDDDDDVPPPKNSTGDFSENCLPKSGVLSFIMSDGKVQKINLNSVQKVSHKP